MKFQPLVKGLTCFAVLLVFLSAVSIPCSMVTSCKNGDIIFCNTFGTCPEEECEYRPGAYVSCQCMKDVWIVESCEFYTGAIFEL